MKSRRCVKIIMGSILALITIVSIVLFANRKKSYITNGGEY